MSCEVRITGSIRDIEKIKKCLFPLDDKSGNDNWLQSCIISVSNTGELVVIANERKIVVLTSSWDVKSSTNFFEISYCGSIHDYDKVKAVMCLSIFGHNGTPEWICLLIGFDSGYVRFYTENCDLIFEKQFNAENIIAITSKSQRDLSHSKYPEEIYVQYQSVMCVVNGSQLISLLTNYYNKISEPNPDILIVKKWGFQEQSVINDSVVVGLNSTNIFDHLLTASTCGGFYTKYRTTPPNHTLVVAAGSKPFIGYHYALEGEVQPILSDVAKAVANKLKSTLPNWLVGSKAVQEKQMSSANQPADVMGCRFGLCDLRRTATDIIISPDHKLAAISDSLGRILLLDSLKGVVIRIFKGYREAQCSFIQVADGKNSKHRIRNKTAHFLLIYSPKKGTIEIFSVQQGCRIAIFTADKYSRLLYTNLVESKSTVLIDNHGIIKEILIPFHFTLSEKNKNKARDLHLYKKLKHLLNLGELENKDLINTALNICTEIKTIEVKNQCLELLLHNKNTPPEVSLHCIQYFKDNIEEDETNNFKLVCENVCNLLNLYIFLTNYENNESTDSNLTNIDITEIIDIKKLTNLSFVYDTGNIPETHVRFEDYCAISEFISVFNYTTPPFNTFKSNIDNNTILNVAQVFFKPYIEGNVKNFNTLQEKLKQSKISTKNLFDLLLNYWTNRSPNISFNLEEKIRKILTLLNLIVEISREDIDNSECSEVSKFWSQIRNTLINSSRPFPALIAAILCKNIAENFVRLTHIEEPEDIEVLTQEDIQWTLLVGKLEDISLLDVTLSTTPLVEDCSLPKLAKKTTDVSLKYILEKGKGSVSELVAQWLSRFGINPESIVLNEIKNCQNPDDVNVNEFRKNENIFQYFNLLKEQFPFSLQANSILTNLSWEYASAWQKEMENLSLLQAAVTCLKTIPHFQVRQGLYQLLWNTQLKIVTENICKLINLVGKLPKKRLCKQDTGLTDYQISLFLNISTDFLDTFMDTVKSCDTVLKENLIFESIWENGGKPLIELAMHQKDVNFELLFLHYQLSLVLLMLATFSIKHSKPINNLFEASVVNLFFTDFQKNLQILTNKSDIQLNNSRNQFLLKIITASIESVTITDSGKIYSTDHVYWMSKCLLLGKIWNMDVDALRRFQIVLLFRNGFDKIGIELIPMVNDNKELGKSLLIIAAKRLQQFLVSSPKLSENISSVSTVLTQYLESLNEDWCSSSSLNEISLLATQIIHCLTEDDNDYKLATLILDAVKSLDEILKTSSY